MISRSGIHCSTARTLISHTTADRVRQSSLQPPREAGLETSRSQTVSGTAPYTTGGGLISMKKGVDTPAHMYVHISHKLTRLKPVCLQQFLVKKNAYVFMFLLIVFGFWKDIINCFWFLERHNISPSNHADKYTKEPSRRRESFSSSHHQVPPSGSSALCLAWTR